VAVFVIRALCGDDSRASTKLFNYVLQAKQNIKIRERIIMLLCSNL